MKLVEVSPISNKVAKDSLTYFSSKEISVGDIVSVEVRKKKYNGLVTTINDVRSAKSDLKSSNIGFKKIDLVKGRAPFYPEFFESAKMACDYFVGNLGQIINYFIPSDFLKNYEDLPKPKKRTVGSSVFFIAPTVSDAEKIFKSLKTYEQKVFLIHGKLRPKILTERYAEILRQDGPVTVVMTPNFLFIPRHDVGEFLISNEISSYFRTIKRPYFDLRVFIKILAEKSNIKLSYDAGLVSTETHAKIKNKFIEQKMTSTKIVDMSKKENRHKKNFILSIESEEILRQKAKSFLFVLRKGLATQVICHDCGTILTQDGTPVSLHESNGKRILRNIETGKTYDTKVRCENCNSWNFDSLGIGADTVSTEVKKIFPKREIFEINSDTVKNTKKAKEILESFLKTSDGILIGTELALSFLDEKEKIENSIIISMDSLLYIPSYKIYEKMLYLTKAIKNTCNNLIIQTRQTENHVIESFTKKDLNIFYERDLELRKKFCYPPFGTIIKISRKTNRDDFNRATDPLLAKISTWEPLVRRLKRGKAFEKIIILRLPKKVWNENFQDPHLFEILSSLTPDWQTRINPETL